MPKFPIVPFRLGSKIDWASSICDRWLVMTPECSIMVTSLTKVSSRLRDTDCRTLSIALALVKGLGLPEVLFDSRFDECFCERCRDPQV